LAFKQNASLCPFEMLEKILNFNERVQKENAQKNGK
jgi:hypothetical protein